MLNTTNKPLKNWMNEVIESFYSKPQNKHIFIPYATELSCLCDAIKTDTDNTYTLQVTDSNAHKELTQDIFKDCKHINYVTTELWDKNFSGTFDYIFCIAPIQGRLGVTRFKTVDVAGITLEVLSNSLNKNGKLTIILPTRVALSQSQQFEQLRNYINEKFTITSISVLPANPYSSIKQYEVTLVPKLKDQSEISITEYIVNDKKTNKFETNGSTVIAEQNLTEQKNWSPYYFLAQNEQEISNTSEKPSTRICKHFEVIRGRDYKMMNKPNNQTISATIINIKDIKTDTIDLENCDTMELDLMIAKKYILQENDLVFSCRGDAIKIGVIPNTELTCLPSQNVIILRAISGSILPEYLKLFIDSPIGNRLIERFQRGNIIKQISHKDLEQLSIPLLSIEEQESLIQQYKEAKAEYDNAIKKWQDSKAKIYTSFC